MKRIRKIILATLLLLPIITAYGGNSNEPDGEECFLEEIDENSSIDRACDTV